jgi:hypothetical protein
MDHGLRNQPFSNLGQSSFKSRALDAIGSKRPLSSALHAFFSQLQAHAGNLGGVTGAITKERSWLFQRQLTGFLVGLKPASAWAALMR